MADTPRSGGKPDQGLLQSAGNPGRPCFGVGPALGQTLGQPLPGRRQHHRAELLGPLSAQGLKFGAGGPVGQAHLDGCIWPAKPVDDDCDEDTYKQTRSGDAVMGSSGDLMDGVPELTGAEFRAEDAIQEGGRHYYFTSSTAPAQIVGNYQAALEEAGWQILDSGGGGDPFGLFASGANLTATDAEGVRYLKLHAGGPNGSTFIDGCAWPEKPSDDNCGQNDNND